MNLSVLPPAPIELLSLPGWELSGVTVEVLHLDAWDVFKGGNKYFKLLFNLKHFLENEYDAMVTFGGAYSNHLAAFASMKEEMPGKRFIAIVRGDEDRAESVTLQRLRRLGVEIVAVERPLYRQLCEGMIPGFFNHFGKAYVIPEGGSNAAGVKGCELIADYCEGNYDEIMLPIATGSTMAGIVRALKLNTVVSGVAVLKGENYLETQLQKMLSTGNEVTQLANYRILHDYHFGGYTRSSKELDAFISMMRIKSSVPVEPIYSGKMFYAIHQKIINGQFPTGTKLLAIHTGGMQYLQPIIC